MSSHYASLRSERLQRLLNCFEIYRTPSSYEMQTFTASCNISADRTELEKNGYVLGRKYIGKINGRRITRFWIKKRPETAAA